MPERIDRSEGWDAVAERFIAVRSDVGAELVRSWARDTLPRSCDIVDVGCGPGVPIAQALVEEGFSVSGIDASPALIAAFQRRFPDARTACEPAQDSPFFDTTFDAAVAIGLLFLLSEDDQVEALRRIAKALKPGARLLFSAPREACEWRDLLTGRPSRSLGEQAYAHQLQASGLRLVACHVDAGANHYYDAAKPKG